MQEINLKNHNVSLQFSELEYNLITTKIIPDSDDKKWISTPNNDIISIFRKNNKIKCFEFNIYLIDKNLYSIPNFKVNKQFFTVSNPVENDKLYIDMLIYLINRVLLKNILGSPPDGWHSIRLWNFIGSDALPDEINSICNY